MLGSSLTIAAGKRRSEQDQSSEYRSCWYSPPEVFVEIKIDLNHAARPMPRFK